jgi:hypothetical protein
LTPQAHVIPGNQRFTALSDWDDRSLVRSCGMACKKRCLCAKLIRGSRTEAGVDELCTLPAQLKYE